MKTLILSVFAAFSTTAAFAGEAAVEPTNGSGVGALIMLTVLGIVIASGTLGGAATRGTNDMDIDPTDINDDIGH